MKPLWRSSPLEVLGRWRRYWAERNRRVLPVILSQTAPLDLRIMGRMLLHAALVGLAAGAAGAAFFAALEHLQTFLLEEVAGYAPLRAHGEALVAHEHAGTFRPWLLLLLPAAGGLVCGVLTLFAPEIRGGGGDEMIDAFHRHGGLIRRRVIGLKAVASLFTLGTGGAGGREGPTMQIGGALGSLVARVLKVSSRERRILLVAGVAAGISAVFRTPLGAAILAVEVLYKDGFESDALIPSVLASVISYSVVITIFGESTLLAHAPRFPFVPAHLPLYGLMALLIAVLAGLFVVALSKSKTVFSSLGIPSYLRPALGGLALGAVVTPIVMFVGWRVSSPGQGLGLLGGGYGAVQMAISGAEWLPHGWSAVYLLLALSMAKLVASSLTIGSGGSAGDFAPALAIGGLFGGAFGRAVQLLLNDPRIDPGAFALVGMGAFYGGIAHVPLSALVLVCELAGNYDLLVPLMLALGISYIASRKRSLYHAQVATQRDSPIHRDALLLDILKAVPVKDVMIQDRVITTFTRKTPASVMVDSLGDATWQEVFPVVGEDGALVGIVSMDSIRVLSGERGNVGWALAADVMQPPVSVHVDDDLRSATQLLITNGLREIPVLDGQRKVVGVLDEREVAKLYLAAEARMETGPHRAASPNP